MQTFARIASLLHRYHTEWLNELGILTKQARIKHDVVNLIFQATVPVTRFLDRFYVSKPA